MCWGGDERLKIFEAWQGNDQRCILERLLGPQCEGNGNTSRKDQK